MNMQFRNRISPTVAFTLAALIAAPGARAQGGIFQKAIGKVAAVSGKVSSKLMGGMLFGSTDNLSSNAPGIILRSNLYPKSVGVLEVDMFGKGWQDGGDGIMIVLQKRRGIKMSKLEGGSVTVDGQPATFQDLGVYTYVAPHRDEPHVVELRASNGEQARFTLTPLADQTRILSINGQAGDNIPLDLTKEVVLELSNPGPADGAMIQVSLTASKIGLNTFYEVGNFRPAARIVIPAEAFANMGVPGDMSVTLGNSYMQVARVKWADAGAASGAYKQVPYVAAAMDGRFIKVVGRPPLSSGIKVAGVYKGGKRKLEWAFAKEEADLSRPFRQATKIGVAAFGTRGVSAAESHDEGRTTGIRTDAWASFTPSDAFLEKLNEALYRQVTSATAAVTGGEIVGPEQVAATAAWRESNLMAETDEGTASSYARAYRAGKILSDVAIQQSYRPIADGKTLSAEAGVTALLRCVLDLSLRIDKGGNMSLTPILTYTLYGQPAGINSMPTRFAEGTIQAKDIPVSKKTSEAELLELLDLEGLSAALREGLMALRKAESEAPYETIWSLQ